MNVNYLYRILYNKKIRYAFWEAGEYLWVRDVLRDQNGHIKIHGTDEDGYLIAVEFIQEALEFCNKEDEPKYYGIFWR